MSVLPSYWVIVAVDIANGGGMAAVTLKSGAAFTGRVDRKYFEDTTIAPDALHLKTSTGWIVIDLEEIAAMEGSR